MKKTARELHAPFFVRVIDDSGSIQFNVESQGVKHSNNSLTFEMSRNQRAQFKYNLFRRSEPALLFRTNDGEMLETAKAG